MWMHWALHARSVSSDSSATTLQVSIMELCIFIYTQPIYVCLHTGSTIDESSHPKEKACNTHTHIYQPGHMSARTIIPTYVRKCVHDKSMDSVAKTLPFNYANS